MPTFKRLPPSPKTRTLLEALQDDPQSGETQTAFWTAYKPLADEFDREFQRKYGNDLDVSLIFAGLFSAVTSAFIIQIQPEFRPDPTANTEALLMILVGNMTGANFQEAQILNTSAGPSVIILITQSLLYFSLFSTLLGSLLAVLGKQWLLHYDSVGERGSIEDRGLERQRKFDGLQRWKFNLVMQLFPLLLQFSLLLFAVALSIYLWTIHHALGAIVLGLTLLGCIFYTLMVISALKSPDSPFQTSLTAVLRLLITSKRWMRLYKASSRFLHQLRGPFSRAWSSMLGFIRTISPPLPQFHTGDRQTSRPDPYASEKTFIFYDIPPSSKEISAVMWALETSTDPQLVEAAAAIVPNLQWPVNMDLRAAVRQLADTFNGCIIDNQILEGKMDRASKCIRAFGVLQMVTEREDVWSDLWTFNNRESSILQYFRLDSAVSLYQLGNTPPAPPITQWILRFISAQHASDKQLIDISQRFQPDKTALGSLSVFSNFLFCMCSCFVAPLPRDISLLDKSSYCVPLMSLLFEHLSKYQFDPIYAAGLVRKILLFRECLDIIRPEMDDRCRTAIHGFCLNSGVPKLTVASLIHLIKVPWEDLTLIYPTLTPRENTEWVYSVLCEPGLDSRSTCSLFQVLLGYTPLQSMPSRSALIAILQWLSSDDEQTQSLTIDLLLSEHQWFLDSDCSLFQILQRKSVWTTIGEYISKPSRIQFPPLRDYLTAYLELGGKLSKIPWWQTVIAQDLPSWLSVLDQQDVKQMGGKNSETFCDVLSRVWKTDITETEPLGEEHPQAMAFITLTNVWDQFDASNTHNLPDIPALIQCTVKAAFALRLGTGKSPSQQFKGIVMRLGKAVTDASEKAKAAIPHAALEAPPNSMEAMAGAAEILFSFGSVISGELRNGPSDSDGLSDCEGPAESHISWEPFEPQDDLCNYPQGGLWTELKQGFDAEVDALRPAFDGYGSRP